MLKLQLKTTLSSLAQRKAGIQSEDLLTVPALDDAIRITRKLGIAYLWIDSLCILQDDISDWERNSSSMDRVYGCAKVTLVAAASRSCREGFLRVKGKQLLLPFRSMIQPTLTGLIQIQFKFVFTGGVEEAQESHADFHNTPLSRRGWTVQERLLAARQIVFGPCNVHFDCAHFRISRLDYWGELKTDRVVKMSEITNLRTSKLYEMWSKVVREFMYITAESFTEPSDILPALSGLAHGFNRQFRDDYCAGHWKKNLFISLMWNRWNFSNISKTTHLQSHRSPIPYLLPSWSYLCKGYLKLCFHGIIQTEQGLWHNGFLADAPEAEYLDWERCLRGNDPMGALKSAKLKIRTRVMNLRTIKILEVKHPRPGDLPTPVDLAGQKWMVACGDHVETESYPLNIHLDYNTTKDKLGLDVLGWKWILLGSCSMCYERKSRLGPFYRTVEEKGYPYGLLVAKLWEEKEEWCRIGTFAPEAFGDFSLEQFMEFSEMESITIV